MHELVIESKEFTKSELSKIESAYLNRYPIVYVLHSTKQPEAYIGQTVNSMRRMKDHLSNSKRAIHDRTILIGHKEFNQSATYNIETNLINYFIADNHYKLQNVSQTVRNQTHDYYRKEYYHEHVFNEIWARLQQEKLVFDTLENLKNKDIFKLSPYKELSDQQLEIKSKILQFCKTNIVKDGHHVLIIEGDAGTGKSVLLSSLFNTLQDYSKDRSSTLADKQNYLLVNHSEMIKTYQSIAYSLPNLKKKNFQKPTSFINKIDKTSRMADIVLIDEAHLLLSKEDTYNNFNFDNQLDEIIKRSKISIIIFDSKQVLKLESFWDKESVKRITQQYPTETYYLTDQFRMNAGPDIVTWINKFISKELCPIPKKQKEDYELKVFESSEKFKKAIKKKNEKLGLCRMVSTFDYLHKKDGKKYYVDEDGINLPWNITNPKVTWAEEECTIHEVGSTYTVQGFDLNVVGVILGPSVGYDEERDKLHIDTTKYKDTKAFRNRKDLTPEENQRIKEEIILNSINVLLKRGIRGLYIYATDPKLRRKLLSLQRNEDQ
jgi:uncharacterized protein